MGFSKAAYDKLAPFAVWRRPRHFGKTSLEFLCNSSPFESFDFSTGKRELHRRIPHLGDYEDCAFPESMYWRILSMALATRSKYSLATMQLLVVAALTALVPVAAHANGCSFS